MSEAEQLEAIVVPRSRTGNSIYDVECVDASNILDFLPDRQRHADACRRLRALGFAIHHFGGPAIIIRGHRELFDRAFHPSAQGSHAVRAEQHHELAHTIDRANRVSPLTLHSDLSPNAPAVGYHRFDVPNGLASALNAKREDVGGMTGTGTRVAVCDSGYFAHPWFTSRGFRVKTTSLPGAGSAHSDEIGHGTAVIACLLSVAPGCDVVSIKMNFGAGSSASSDAVLSLQAAAHAGADIINCSWGGNVASSADMTHDLRDLEYVVTLLNHQGRTIVSTAGNYPRENPNQRGDFGYPGQHRDVIAVGGCGVDAAGNLRASNYASGFGSLVYPGRQVPDVSGVCGMLPAGVLITSPVPPNSAIDRMAAAAPYPDGDDTEPNDGWASLSGTSLAAPQVSGTLALMLEACPALRGTTEPREILMSTARDVSVGVSNPQAVHPGQSNSARRGNDVATGAGLIDTKRAVALAQKRRSSLDN